MKTKRSVLFMPVIIPALILLQALIFQTSIFGQDRSDANSSANTTGLDAYLTNIVASQNYVGLGACLARDGKIIWEGAYGYADLEAKKGLRKDNIFQLASLSKVVTAAALMQLYEKGMFKLDDDVNSYIPIKVRNPNFPDKPITFRMLLTHTAGFDDVLPAGNKLNLGTAGDSPIALSDFVEGLFTPGGKYYSSDYFSKNEPGTKYGYSNIAFSLIGYIVEKLARKDFSEYCTSAIFKPLGMDNTNWHLKGLDTGRVVLGYGFPKSDSLNSYRKVRHFGVPGYPEGMLRTTMQDFVKFLSIFTNKGRYNDYQVLKPETVDLMLTPQGIKNIPTRSFPVKDIGLTWLIFNVDGEDLYSMNGFSGSIFTNAFFSTKDCTIILYYYTGISMKNMQGSFDITKKLKDSLNKQNVKAEEL